MSLLFLYNGLLRIFLITFDRPMGPTVSHTLGSVIRADEDHCVARFRRKVEQEFQIVPK